MSACRRGKFVTRFNIDDSSLSTILLHIAGRGTHGGGGQEHHDIAHSLPVTLVFGSLGRADLLGYGPSAVSSLVGRSIVSALEATTVTPSLPYALGWLHMVARGNC